MNQNRPSFRLTDAGLFRQQAYIDGQWCDAENHRIIEVTDPASGAVIGTVPAHGRRRDGERLRGQCRHAGLAGQNGQGARRVLRSGTNS